MKKNLVLALVALAFLAVPVMAEPTFSAEVDYGFVFNPDPDQAFDYPDDDNGGNPIEIQDVDSDWQDLDNSVSVTFDGTISDFTSISAKIKGDEDDKVEVDTLILTQDVTGALGLDGAVDFTLKLGKQKFAPKDYGMMKDPDAEVGVFVEADGDKVFWLDGVEPDTKIPGEEFGGILYTIPVGDDSNYVGFVTSFLIVDMLNIDLALYPSTYANEVVGDEEFGLNIWGEFGDAKVSAYYVVSNQWDFVEDVDDDDALDYNGDFFGLNTEVTLGDAIVSGLYEIALSKDINDKMVSKAALAGSYTLSDVTFKLGTDVENLGAEDADFVDNTDVDFKVAYAADSFNVGTSLEASLDDFAAESELAFNADYTLDAAKFFAKINFATFKDFKAEDHLEYDLGVTYTLDTVAYSLGYANDSDSQDIIDDDHETGVFFLVKASF